MTTNDCRVIRDIVMIGPLVKCFLPFILFTSLFLFTPEFGRNLVDFSLINLVRSSGRNFVSALGQINLIQPLQGGKYN